MNADSTAANPILEDFDLSVEGHHLRARWVRAVGAAKKDRPPLVFLHEGLGCIDMWKDFPEQVARKLSIDVLVFDRLGHGRSGPLPSARIDPQFMHTEAYRFLPQILDQCGIRRSILLGHSDGGTIALLFAARNMQQVAGIVTEGAHVFVDKITIQGIKQAVYAYTRADLRNRLLSYHGKNLENMFRRWSGTWLSDQFRNWDIQTCLPHIACPVLVIQGENDEYGTPEQAGAIASGVGGPAEVFFIPGCRHVPHHQARGAVICKIQHFINKYGI